MSEWAETLLRALMDHSLRIALVAVVAGTVLFILRIRPGSVRHATWTAVLAAMLLMPIISSFAPAIPVGFLIPSSRIETTVIQAPEEAPSSQSLPPGPVADPMPAMDKLSIRAKGATIQPTLTPPDKCATVCFISSSSKNISKKDLTLFICPLLKMMGSTQYIKQKIMMILPK